MTGTVVVHGLQGFTALQMSHSSSRLQHREDDVSGVPRSSSSSIICSCSVPLSLSHVPGVVRRELDDLLPSVTSRFFFYRAPPRSCSGDVAVPCRVQDRYLALVATSPSLQAVKSEELRDALKCVLFLN
ncbi:hypothetical protein NL676_029773 [Syzygium grande]|nr:hypothetical protein NL676_029773 [Syzygium grande]